MKWRKCGRIFHFEPSAHRGTTHIQLPTPWDRGDVVRVYFAARNLKGQSYPAYIDVDRKDPTKVLEVHDGQILALGSFAMFDEDGIMPNCVSRVGEEVWMYYSGWNRGGNVPYHNTTGIAVSHDNGNTFERKFDGPVLERTHLEPWMAMTPWVVREGKMWHMWYAAGTGWENVDGKLEPVYVVRYADSEDGIAWRRTGMNCLPQLRRNEAQAHPCVIRIGSTYHMWFAHRDPVDFRHGAGSYRMGYASSEDAIRWNRHDDDAGIDVSTEGWDSKMLSYPSVIEVDGKYIMFHNGNSFGQTGIGAAILEL
jgi:predicted GH43/DUF377 family glycosyl hydrolase